MSFFGKKEEEEPATAKYDKQYDIFRDKDVLEALEREIAIHGEHVEDNGRTPFLRLCEAKGYIAGKIIGGHYDFAVTQQVGIEPAFLDISRKETALRRLQAQRV